jgi:hypothetical protein
VQRQRDYQRLCFRQIDLLSRAKHSALTGIEIGRDDPQPEGHIERIDASVDQKLSSPTRCCFAWQAVHRGTA